MADVLEDSRDKVQENLLANGGTVPVTTHKSLHRKKINNPISLFVKKHFVLQQWPLLTEVVITVDV